LSLALARATLGWMPIAPGARLDRYEVLQRVAWGGMGEVWLGRLDGKHGFEKLVAIKTMLPEIAGDERLRTMFLDEARLASRVAHANVAQVFDLGEAEGLLYLVMEWVDGESLESLAQRFERAGGSLPLGAALRIIGDACGGLHAAHEARGTDGVGLGLVHRDVSPHNILVSDQGVAKIIDFGIARTRNLPSSDTRGGAKGKVSYMSPEQERGSRVDRRADIWSMGAVLHRVLLGAPPFLEQDSFEAYVDGRAPFPTLPDRVPGPVASIVARALAPHPAARFATAAEMQAAVEDAARRGGVSASTAEVAVSLAVLTPPGVSLAATVPNAESGTSPAASARVLVVSTNARVRARIAAALGRPVEEATGGIAALRKLASCDVVVVDGDSTVPDASSLVISLRSAAATAGAKCHFVVITRDRSVVRTFARRGFDVCLDDDEDIGSTLRALVR
jgi:hypothetical protein